MPWRRVLLRLRVAIALGREVPDKAVPELFVVDGRVLHALLCGELLEGHLLAGGVLLRGRGVELGGGAHKLGGDHCKTDDRELFFF